MATCDIGRKSFPEVTFELTIKEEKQRTGWMRAGAVFQEDGTTLCKEIGFLKGSTLGLACGLRNSINIREKLLCLWHENLIP